MHLPQPLLTLFDYPIDGLLPLLPDADDPMWEVAAFRQARYSAHDATRTIVFEWLENDWRPPAPPIVLKANYAPKPLAQAAYAFAETVRAHRPGRVVKLMLAALKPGVEIRQHIDQSPALTSVHRCHLPLISGNGVVFRIDGTDFQLKPGTAYEMDNRRPHAVRNDSTRSRVHLICDILPDSPSP